MVLTEPGRAFYELITSSVNEFVCLSREFGEPLNSMAAMVKRAFEREYEFIISGLSCPQPAEPDVILRMADILAVISEIQDFRGRNRHHEDFNHLSTVSESIAALSWVNVRPAPAHFIKDLKEAGEYYGNRVLTAHRGDPRHLNWVRKYNEILTNLEQYVRDHHLTGFSWDIAQDAAALRVADVPPPPPPPPPSVFILPDPLAGGDAHRVALINELNQGVNITRILRPVRPNENRPGYLPNAVTPAVRAVAPIEYPPRCILDGRKWRVEHQRDNLGLQVRTNDMSESMAMFKCLNSGVVVVNKINGVSIDNCKRSTVVLNDVIASVEAIRCENLKIQCNGHVPLISVDNCDSVQIFLTENSQDAEIISSKSTSGNVCLLEPDGNYVEMAMPEQIRTIVRNGRLVSTVIEHGA